MADQLYCGVDGGASKTRIALYDGRGHRLGLTVAPPASLTLRGAQAWDVIIEALRELCTTVGVSPDAIGNMQFGIGLAGANNAAQRAQFIAAAPAVGVLHVATDAYIAALAAHGGKPGAIVIVGTGSAGYRIGASGAARLVGGWGFATKAAAPGSAARRWRKRCTFWMAAKVGRPASCTRR